jgi:hypothetical protein
MRAERVSRARRNDRVPRHDPRRDTPVVIIVLGIPASADQQTAFEVDDLEVRHLVAFVVLVAFAADEKRIALQCARVQKAHV